MPGLLEYEEPLEEDRKGKLMLTLDTLRREKKADIIRLAEMRGCRSKCVSLTQGACKSRVVHRELFRDREDVGQAI